MIESMVTQVKRFYFSFFSFLSGEEGEDALRKSAMSSSEIAGLMF